MLQSNEVFLCHADERPTDAVCMWFDTTGNLHVGYTPHTRPEQFLFAADLPGIGDAVREELRMLAAVPAM